MDELDEYKSRIFQIVSNFSSSSLITKTDFIVLSVSEWENEFPQANGTNTDSVTLKRRIDCYRTRNSSSEDDSMNSDFILSDYLFIYKSN